MVADTEDILEWLGFAAFGVGAGIAYLFSLKMSQPSNKARYLALFVFYLLHVAGYGALALGDGDRTRSDNVTVVIGRYILYLSHFLFGIFLALSIVPNYFASLVVGFLACAQQAALLAGCRGTGDLNWFYFACAAVAWLLNVVVILVFVTPDRSSEARPEQSSALSTTAVWIVKALSVVGLAAYLALYILDQAWMGVVTRLVNVILALVVDIVVKLIVGLIVLLFFKPEEDQVDNINLSMGIENGASILNPQHCAQQVNYTPAATAPFHSHLSPPSSSPDGVYVIGGL